MNFKEMIRESSQEMKKAKGLTGCSLLAALNIILDYLRIPVSTTLEISFAFLALAAAGMFYGPVAAAVIGGGADIVAYFIKPNGFFFPGFTLNAALQGFIFGIFLYRKQITLKRVALAVLVETIIINLILTPIWLQIMYGNVQFFAVARVIKNIVQYPINVALCYGLCKNISLVRNKIINQKG